MIVENATSRLVKDNHKKYLQMQKDGWSDSLMSEICFNYDLIAEKYSHMEEALKFVHREKAEKTVQAYGSVDDAITFDPISQTL